MCGRYSLYASPEEVAQVFTVSQSNARSVLAAGPRYNIAPTTAVAAVRQAAADEGRELALLRWGLIPAWSKEVGQGPLLINARAETVAEKPTFRAPFRSRRCLVIANGFFEWQKLPDRKQPYYIQSDDGALLAFAGIWDRWGGEDGPSVESCAILTTRANELMRSVHDRMPVILGPESWDIWLREGDGELQSLLCPYPAERMRAVPVSTLVNSPRTDLPACVEPAGPALRAGDVSR